MEKLVFIYNNYFMFFFVHNSVGWNFPVLGWVCQTTNDAAMPLLPLLRGSVNEKKKPTGNQKEILY